MSDATAGIGRPDRSYQLAFRTPGIWPLLAMFRRQMRHSLNLRYTARDRPHTPHRRMRRVENFGFSPALCIQAFVAIGFVTRLAGIRRLKVRFRYLRNGIPISVSSVRASASFRADVQMVTFMPCWRVTLSGLISGNTVCSLRPIE